MTERRSPSEREQTLILKHRVKSPQDTMERTAGGAKQNFVAKAEVTGGVVCMLGARGWTGLSHTKTPLIDARESREILDSISLGCSMREVRLWEAAGCRQLLEVRF